MASAPYDLESFLQRNKWNIASIMLAPMCIPATSAAAMAIALFTPVCVLFIAASGLLFARAGIIIAALLSMVFLASIVVMGIVNLF